MPTLPSRCWRRFLLLLFVNLFSVTILGRAGPIYYVNFSSLRPEFPFASWETAATNIQEGVDAALQYAITNGLDALVLVTNGVYSGGGRSILNAANRVAVDLQMTIQSVNGPEATVIEGSPSNPDGTGGVRCVYLANNSVLSGFTLRGGHAVDSGGGVYCVSGVVTNCIITGNSAPLEGGAVFGGIVYNSVLVGNSAAYGGGATRCDLFDCKLTGNSAAAEGGGARVCMLRNCVLSGNSVTGPLGAGGGAWGGSLYNCKLTGNSAEFGGAVSHATVHGCTMATNLANSDGGGALGGTLYHCKLIGNSARVGGGAFMSELNYCAVVGNIATAPRGSGAGAWSSKLYNCTLTGNSSIGEFGQGGGAARSTVYNSIVYFNAAPVDANFSACTFEYSCTTPLPPGPSNINADPGFINFDNGDLHLRYGSPCIDTAAQPVNAIRTDLDDRVAPLDGDGDGIAAFDLGAYEFDASKTPVLTMKRLGPDDLTLEWNDAAKGMKLQRTPNLTTPDWEDVPGSEITRSIVLPLGIPSEFFRLRF